ncbi:MAG: hypothetical protein HXY34_04010, partial [Candidatus Thorarchaeota archaeon]|nr:hypothetical protein [Candidatus Thorarchaeota archaeon]
ALFVFAFVGAMLGFWFFGVVNYGETAFAPGGVVLWVPMILLALVGSVTATLVELISPKGTDNITLPFASMLVMLFVGLQWGLFAL